MITFKSLGRLGRLGNQMFQIASTIGIAMESGQQYAFPYWMNYDAKERFGSTENIDVQGYFQNHLPILEDEERYQFRDYPYYWGYRKLVFPSGNWNLNAHMQSEKYFLHCADLIREYFQIKNPCQQNDFVAVHMRFGDYDGNYHPTVKADWLREAVKNFPGERFIIFSDDQGKAMGRALEAGILHQVAAYGGGTDYLSDFNFMQSCRSFIICNSTYSWWAAWLGEHPDKKVICPRKWHGDHTGLDPTDLYCQNWIIL